LHEHCNQPRRCFQKRFAPIRAERSECFKPGGRCAVLVEFTFFLFCGDANVVFNSRITNRNEIPRLQICTVWGRSRCPNTLLDHFPGNRTIGEIADRSSLLYSCKKFHCSFNQLLIGVVFDFRCWDKTRSIHIRTLATVLQRRDRIRLGTRVEELKILGIFAAIGPLPTLIPSSSLVSYSTLFL